MVHVGVFRPWDLLVLGRELSRPWQKIIVVLGDSEKGEELSWGEWSLVRNHPPCCDALRIRGVRSPTRQHSPQLPYVREIDESKLECSCGFRSSVFICLCVVERERVHRLICTIKIGERSRQREACYRPGKVGAYFHSLMADWYTRCFFLCRRFNTTYILHDEQYRS